MSWEEALKAATDDYVIMTKVRRFISKQRNGNYLPREAVVARSLLDSKGKVVFHEELTRPAEPTVA